MRNLKSITVLILFSISAFAQNGNQQYIDLSIAAGAGFSPSLSVTKLWGLGKNKKFKIGTGLRFTNISSGEKPYITAPSKIINGKTGPLVFFEEYIPEKLDTILIPKTAVNYLNIPIHLQYSFGKKFDIGFNIDAIGFSFGSKKTGKFKSSAVKSLNNTNQVAKPTAFNALLISNNDIGSLNSELYGRYWIKPNLGIRAGLSFQFSEYTTENILSDDNDRFRFKYLLPMVAVSYKF